MTACCSCVSCRCSLAPCPALPLLFCSLLLALFSLLAIAMPTLLPAPLPALMPIAAPLPLSTPVSPAAAPASPAAAIGAAASRLQVARACTAQATLSTPLGPVLLARTPQGLAGVWFEGQRHHPGPLAAPNSPDDPLLRRTAEQLLAYFAGTSSDFDLPLDLQGTPFQRAVWQAMLGIEHGRTRSYRDIATRLGSASAVRAVGSAVGRNPVSVIVPCHRVIGSDGSLTGYAGGIHRKRALLDLEFRSGISIWS